jgi:tetratricopeptide (TPR) repeat protein
VAVGIKVLDSSFATIMYVTLMTSQLHLSTFMAYVHIIALGNLLDTTENDPAWLKSKADEFYRGGDYLSSVSAYSAAIELDKSIPALYSNRSACYMQLLMLSECRTDCTEGIRLIDEELAGILSRQSSSTTTNAVHGESLSLRVMLTKLLMRRGSASCQVGAFTEALSDFTRSYTILFGYLSKASTSAGTLDQVKNQSHDVEFSLPGVTKASLLVDLEKVEKLLKAEALKKEGDALFAEEKLSESHGKYTDALHLVPVHVGCLSNRSACSLTSKNIHSCIDDCSDALSILRDTDSSSSRHTCGGSQFDMLNSILPRIGSAKRTSWVVKTLLRRGAAHAQLNHLAEAIEDYSAAFVLEPLNEVLKSDLDKMIAYRETRRAGTVLEA